MSNRRIRIGILGAASIAPAALVTPAAKSTEVEVAAVAARDEARAAAFAAKNGIETVHGGYEALIEDTTLDAIYNPLPNSLHGRWTREALLAGKHVLCEKPFTANAEEAQRIADLASASGCVVMEAFHYRYHPLTLRIEEIIRSGELGPLRHVEAAMCFPLPKFSDIRYDYALGGGATMDAGSYAIHMARTYGAETPTVVSARAKLHSPRIDRAMTADLQYPSGHTGTIYTSLWSTRLLQISARIVGERGEVRVLNPVMPQVLHRMSVHTTEGRRVEVLTRRSSYEYQLEAFVAAIRDGAPVKTGPVDSVQNMMVVDDVYHHAGLPLRQPA